jgi:hypothetical protein
MIHDLLIVIDIDEFSKMYTDSKITEIVEGNPKKVVFLKIKVNDTDYTYKTVQTIFSDQTWSTSFLTNKNETFFEIMIESENVASCDIKLKNKKTDIQCITLNGTLLSPLETTFYLRTYYCEMLKVSFIHIKDVANSVCKGDKSYKTMYFLIPYRIFARNDLKLQDISIYSKFYNYKRDPAFTNDDEEILTKYRNMKIELIESMSDIKFDVKDKTQTLSIFFSNFLENENCGKFATLLNKVNLLLLKMTDYSNLYDKISDYIVKNKYSIYYENSYQFKSKRCKKSNKKRKSHRMSTIKKSKGFRKKRQ